MKEIKAYIRTNMINKVVRALEEADLTDMTVIDVKAIRRSLSQPDIDYSLELAEPYMNMAKLEMVLTDSAVEQAKAIILKTARTGRRGDGLIYVSQVEEAIHIRTGTRRGGGSETPLSTAET